MQDKPCQQYLSQAQVPLGQGVQSLAPCLCTSLHQLSLKNNQVAIFVSGENQMQ